MSKEQIDINKELEELPGLISYQEQLVEDKIMEISDAKSNKNKALAETLMEYEKSSYIAQKAMYKKTMAEEDAKINKLKKELSKMNVEFNRLKNRFQSVRKLASLRIEEMKHGLEYRKGVDE